MDIVFLMITTYQRPQDILSLSLGGVYLVNGLTWLKVSLKTLKNAFCNITANYSLQRKTDYNGFFLAP
jgi:hypothetical protein